MEIQLVKSPDTTLFLSLRTDSVNYESHNYRKKELVDLAFHIYVPKGTHLEVRKSTWLQPIIDGKEALTVKVTKKDLQKTGLSKSFDVLCEAKKQNEEIERMAKEFLERDKAAEAKLLANQNPKTSHSFSDMNSTQNSQPGPSDADVA